MPGFLQEFIQEQDERLKEAHASLQTTKTVIAMSRTKAVWCSIPQTRQHLLSSLPKVTTCCYPVHYSGGAAALFILFSCIAVFGMSVPCAGPGACITRDGQYTEG